MRNFIFYIGGNNLFSYIVTVNFLIYVFYVHVWCTEVKIGFNMSMLLSDILRFYWLIRKVF